MRIVSGSAKGRALEGPRGPGIRPTSDRVRESLFNTLGQTLDPVDVLDLFAGTGALGLEALSRGAATVLFVDSSREGVELCQRNAAHLGFTAQVEIWKSPVDRALEKLASSPRRFSLVFADPPYAAHAGLDVLTGLTKADVLLPGGWLVLEHDKRETLPEELAELRRDDTRSFGDTRVALYHRGVGD